MFGTITVLAVLTAVVAGVTLGAMMFFSLTAWLVHAQEELNVAVGIGWRFLYPWLHW